MRPPALSAGAVTLPRVRTGVRQHRPARPRRIEPRAYTRPVPRFRFPDRAAPLPCAGQTRFSLDVGDRGGEICAKGLPHCAPDFDIVIHTEEDYVVERQELMNLGLHKLHLDPLPMPEGAVHSYVASNPDLIATIDGKL